MTPNLEDTLKCAFADIGAQVGELLHCMISAEIASHVVRIQQLQGALDGSLCTPHPEIIGHSARRRAPPPRNCGLVPPRNPTK